MGPLAYLTDRRACSLGNASLYPIERATGSPCITKRSPGTTTAVTGRDGRVAGPGAGLIRAQHSEAELQALGAGDDLQGCHRIAEYRANRAQERRCFYQA